MQNLPDFVNMSNNQPAKPTAAELLAQIKSEELQRLNAKLAGQKL